MRTVLVEHPLSLAGVGVAAISALRAGDAAQERAVVLIAAGLDVMGMHRTGSPR